MIMIMIMIMIKIIIIIIYIIRYYINIMKVVALTWEKDIKNKVTCINKWTLNTTNLSKNEISYKIIFKCSYLTKW
jgi:hypothetical protein